MVNSEGGWVLVGGIQARVFLAPPSNCRRIIVATNLAETSLTVDGVVYAV